MKTSLYAGVAIAAVLLAVLVVWMQPTSDNLPDESLFPDLTDVEMLNGIERVELSRDGRVGLTVFRDETGLWRLRQKGGYPADHQAISKLLDSVATAVKIERKTDNPAYYGRLGVSDKEPDGGFLLALSGAAKQWQLIVGLPAQDNKSGQYVRVKGEKDSWLINQRLAIPSHYINWLNRRVVHVEPDDVNRLTLKNPRYKKPVVLVRDEKGKDLNYEDAPEDKEITMGLEFSARQLTAVPDYLNFLDIVERKNLASSLTEEFIAADYETFSGMLLGIRAYEIGERDHYAVLEISALPRASTPVVEQVRELQPRFKRWAYQISRSIYEDLDKEKDKFPSYDFGEEDDKE